MAFNNSRQSSQPKLVLNFLPVHIDDAEVTASVLPFESREQIRSLRETHRATYCFRRTQDETLAVPLSGCVEPLGSTSRKINILRNSEIAADLTRRAFFAHLLEKKRALIGDRPIEFLSDTNLLTKWTRSIAEFPEWFQIREVCEIEIRVIWLRSNSPLIVAVFGSRLKKHISANCAELLAAGIPIEGLYVATERADRHPDCQPFRQLAGCVKSVLDGKTLRLTDHREGIESLSVEAAYPESSWATFDRLIGHFGGRFSQSIQQVISMRQAEHRHGPAKLKQLVDLTQYVERQTFHLVDNCKCRFGKLTREGGVGFPPRLRTHPPVYVFDPSGRKTNSWHDKGLDDFGPYHASNFPKSTPRIVMVCQAAKKGRVEQAIHKFLHGLVVPELETKGKRQPYANGFIRKYQLTDARVEFETTETATVTAYESAARRALERATAQSPIHLALVQIDEAFHDLTSRSNPYLATKALFLSSQVPVQEFEYETIDQADRQLAYVFNNMALACYAKLGGVPWLLKADPVIAHELVVGLGSASISESRLGDHERVVGITTLFSGDGQYYLSTVSKSIPFREYAAEMFASVRTSLERARKDMNWQEGDHVRLIFHAFKPLKDEEAVALGKVMKDLGSYQVDYAFLHLVEDHPYQLFDEAQDGVWYAKDKPLKGASAPDRGIYFQFSRNETLLTMTGARDVKQSSDGLPRPLLLRLHRESTFTDMPYLTNQVARFALHSWRSFFPSQLPVTILYSNLIARLLGLLGKLPKWNPDVLLGQIKESRWFL